MECEEPDWVTGAKPARLALPAGGWGPAVSDFCPAERAGFEPAVGLWPTPA
jgi:hypothetical protein